MHHDVHCALGLKQAFQAGTRGRPVTDVKAECLCCTALPLYGLDDRRGSSRIAVVVHPDMDAVRGQPLCNGLANAATASGNQCLACHVVSPGSFASINVPAKNSCSL